MGPVVVARPERGDGHEDDSAVGVRGGGGVGVAAGRARGGGVGGSLALVVTGEKSYLIFFSNLTRLENLIKI